MKKLVSLTLAIILVLSAFLFVSCQNKDDGKKKVGIIQFGSHQSLNNCYDGIIKGLKENGYDTENCTFEYVNSNFDATVSQSQAKKMVNSNYDVIIAIATPSAVASANAGIDKGIPVVYCAVTDSSVMENYENAVGSSDIPDFNKQIELITALLGDNIKIGVLYSSEESSSPFQIKKLKEACVGKNVEIVDSCVSDITTIDTKVNALVDAGVDCFLNLLDNTIVGKLESNILPILNEKGIPCFGSEIEQVKVGCIGASSIDYVEVGRLAGALASDVLDGKEPKNLCSVSISNPTIYVNQNVADTLKITIPTTLECEIIK